MRSLLFCVGVGFAAAACSGSVNSTAALQTPDSSDAGLQAPTRSHNVSITASVVGRVSLGDSVAIRIHNDGRDTAYLPRCGSGPLILVQQFMNGVWTGGVQNFMCVAPSAPGPVQLAPGANIDIARVFQAGRYRITASVATASDLSNASTAVSNAFDAP
jgi:hypothetical protein